MEFILVITVILVATTVGVGVWAIKRGMNNKKATKVLGINIGTFFLTYDWCNSVYAQW